VGVTDATAALRRRLPVGDRVAIGAITVLLVVLLLGSTGSGSESGDRAFDFGAVWLLALGTGFAVMARRAPATGALGTLAVTVAWYSIGYSTSFVNLPHLVAFYLLGVSGDRRKQLLVGGLAVAVTGVATLAAGEPSSSVAGAVGWTIVPILFGELAFNRRALLDELADRAARAEAERDREAERRVARARLEIARDLHDVLAHTVSVMTLHAGVGRDALPRDPEAAAVALDTIRQAGRRAMDEVRALVAVLRSDADAPDTAPAPGLDRIGELVDAARATGLEVDCDVAGDGDVPEVVQLTAYRIVQESLTNVVRHARAGRVAVHVRTRGDGLVVEVRDDGVGGGRPGEGFGLQGMRERVGSLGGTLRAGPAEDGGWQVVAHLPLRRGGDR